LLQSGEPVSSLVGRDDADGATMSTPVVSERSPLIKHATSPAPLITAAFDNTAVVAETPTSAPVSPAPDVDRGVLGKTRSSKKRKVLSIVSRQSWSRFFQHVVLLAVGRARTSIDHGGSDVRQ